MGKSDYKCVSCSKKIVKSSSSNNAPTCLFIDNTKFDLCHWKCVEKMLDGNNYDGIVIGTFTPLDNQHGYAVPLPTAMEQPGLLEWFH